MKEIRQIIATYDKIDYSNEQVALAAVVNVEESSYRRIGARMLVSSSGRWVGGISGGCLEGDALRRSQRAIFSGKAARVVYDTTEEDEHQIGAGLGCNGRIEVLFTPIDPNDPNNEIEQLRQVAAADKPAVMLKVIDAPAGTDWLGLHYLVQDGELPPTFAGLMAEDLKPHLESCANKRKPLLFNPTNEEGPVRVLIEYLRPETRLIIVGDNYDVLAMLGVARTLGWQTFVVGKLSKLNKAVFELADKVVDYAAAETLAMHQHTAVILMSHDYDKDKAMMPIFVRQQPTYIGMLGPKKRWQNMSEELPDLHLSTLPFFYSPTGLEIGAESPDEIALSVAAEILAVFRQKPAGFLREKSGSIHERAYPKV